MIPNYIADLDEYEKISFIGSGAYGEVFLVKRNKTNELYAAKVFKNEISSSQDQKIFFQELIAYSKAIHKSILSLQGFNMMNFNYEHKPTIITNYMKNGSLDIFLKKNPNLPLSVKYIILLGIAEGMKYLHSIGIVHLDLKTGNILLDDKIYPKICDFGFSKISNLSLSLQYIKSFNGTPLYMAPEIILGQPYNYKVDVYSFSIIAYELITGKTPYKKVTNSFNLMNQVAEGKRPDLSIIENEEIKFYLSTWWSADPNKRPKFDQIVEEIKHEAFKKAMNVSQNEINRYIYYLYGKLPPLNNNDNKINRNKSSISPTTKIKTTPRLNKNLPSIKSSNSINNSLFEGPKSPKMINTDNARHISKRITNKSSIDQFEILNELGIQYTYQQKVYSLFSDGFNTKDLIGINNVCEIELAPNRYLKCVFSFLENNVLDKYLSFIEFGKIISFHFSSSPNGHVRYLSLCTGIYLFVIINPNQTSLDIIIKKCKNSHMIPCGLNDKSQFFFYDYHDKLHNFESDSNIQKIIEEINIVKKSIYPRQFSYDISASYEKFLNIAYSTFLGYYIRFQSIEKINVPSEPRKYKYTDFILYRGLAVGKILAFNWPEGKICILKRYLDMDDFNQSLHFYTNNRMSCLMPFLGDVLEKDRKYLVFHFHSRGTLREVASTQYLDPKTCGKIAIQLVFGLAFLNLIDIKLRSITADSISVDWNYDIHFTEYIDPIYDYCLLEEQSASDLLNVLRTLLNCQQFTSLNSFVIGTVYSHCSQIYELCNISNSSIFDVVFEILNNKNFCEYSYLIKKLYDELPIDFTLIKPIKNYHIKYYKADCDQNFKLFYIKTIQFSQETIFHFPSYNILTLETGGTCYTLVNIHSNVVDAIFSKMRNSKVIPVEDYDLQTLYEYRDFDFIQNLMEDQQLKAARSRIPKIIMEMNDFNDKNLVAETLALSYAISHSPKQVVDSNFQYQYSSIIRSQFNKETEIQANLVKTVEVFNNYVVKCLYSTEENYTFNEFVERFEDDKFVTVYFSIDETTNDHYASFCTSNRILLLRANCITQVNKAIEHFKSSKVFGVSPEDISCLFSYFKFDLIESFATKDEMIILRKKVNEASKTLPQSLLFKNSKMKYSSFFKYAGDAVTAYYELISPNNRVLNKYRYFNSNEIMFDFEKDEDEKIVKQIFAKEAEVDNPAAIFNIGLMYSRGQGCQKDKLKASKFYRRAALLGNPKAQYNLAIMHLRGECFHEDKSKASILFELAALKGHHKSQFNLGLMYFTGDNIEQSYSKSVYFFDKAASQNNSNAMVNLGFIYDFGVGVIINKQKAFDYYTKSVACGNIIALYNLAITYQKGEPGVIDKNIQKAIELYTKAASVGYTKAQFNIGLLYLLDTDSTIKDKDKICHFFEMAADVGCPEAQVNLGVIYYNKKEESYTIEAAKLFKKAAKQNNPQAYFNLALMYHNGEGIEKNLRKAEKYYKLASDHNIKQASFNLAILYSKGADGIPKNEKKAAKLFEKAGQINQKDTETLLYVSTLFEKCPEYEYDIFDDYCIMPIDSFYLYDNDDPLFVRAVMNHDKQDMLEYYIKAAENGNEKAQLKLGVMYHVGDGCDVDKEKAKKYYKMAADQGNIQAQLNLGILYL